MAQTFDDFLATVPVGDLASRFGVSESEITRAVSLAAPALLGGMAVNASSDEGASRLLAATDQHHTRAASLADIDTADGRKIVNKVLGDEEPQIAQALGAQAGDAGLSSLIPQLLPILAPLIMQYLAGSFSQGTTAKSSGGLGDLLGGLLGGNAQSSGGLGDVLGGLLGSSSSRSGGIGGLLGGLLGK